jgi:multidrug efflux pump subunit AcrA (membrane-fusion protein)
MEAIPTPIQSLLDLFASDLAEVRFADVDAKTLEHFATDVRSAADVVASAELALDAARAALQERQEALLQQTQRALAYARVYAENDEAMSARLEAITLPRATRRPRAGADTLVLSEAPPAAPRGRGHARKGRSTEPMLDGVLVDG